MLRTLLKTKMKMLGVDLSGSDTDSTVHTDVVANGNEDEPNISIECEPLFSMRQQIGIERKRMMPIWKWMKQLMFKGR